REQLLVRVGAALQRLELLHERVAGEVLVHLGRGDELALLVLDLLGHPLERLEHPLVADRGHRLLDPFVRFGALGARDQDVLLALRILNPIVELAQRQLQLLRFFPVLDPRLVQLQAACACSLCRTSACFARSSRPSCTASTARFSQSPALCFSWSTCAASRFSSAMAPATCCLAFAS